MYTDDTHKKKHAVNAALWPLLGLSPCQGGAPAAGVPEMQEPPVAVEQDTAVRMGKVGLVMGGCLHTALRNSFVFIEVGYTRQVACL